MIASNPTIINAFICWELNDSLINGLAVLEDGHLALVDGRNKVFVINSRGVLHSLLKKKEGMGGFKEPVGIFVSPDKKLFVADWHNHRIVVLDSNLNYDGEFGHYGLINITGLMRLSALLGYFRAMIYTGSYLKAHFGAKRITGQKRKRISLFFEGVRGRILHHGGLISWLRYISSLEHAINKPNGVAFSGSTIAITQKNNKCVSVYENTHPYKLLRHIFGPRHDVKFGRLGNIHYSSGYYYVCDERNSVIWKLNANFSFADEIRGEPSGTIENVFLPFSSVSIDNRFVAVCGGKNFQIIDAIAKKVTFVSDSYGELHGIDYDPAKKKLYLADRLNASVLVFDIKSVPNETT